MKALITRRSIIIASTALLLALFTIVSVNVFNSAGPVTGVANTITRPIRALAAEVAQVFETIFSAIYRYEELERRNEELLRRIAQYETDFREATLLAEENETFRLLLEFRLRHGARIEHEMASLESWGSDNWSSSFIINRGYMNSDVRRGMGVATEEGVLLGQVFEVRATQSTVITILDTTFSAGGFVGRGDGGGDDGSVTIRGNFNYMRNRLLTIDHIDDDVVVLHGALVTTSGIGGLLPAGLIVGEVVDVFTHPNGIGRYATVRPMRDIDTISEVFIITAFDIHD